MCIIHPSKIYLCVYFIQNITSQLFLQYCSPNVLEYEHKGGPRRHVISDSVTNTTEIFCINGTYYYKPTHTHKHKIFS